MQMKKAGVVATGALATVAVMGAPAAAAVSHVDASALTKASTLNLARGDGWEAPWDVDPQALLVTGSGTVNNDLAWQFCGSTTVGGGGVAAPISSPNTVWGECNNGNVKLTQDAVPALIGLGNNSAYTLGTWQSCGSTSVDGYGLALPIQSPNTVIGDCANGNIVIGNKKHDHDWDHHDGYGDGYGDSYDYQQGHGGKRKTEATTVGAGTQQIRAAMQTKRASAPVQAAASRGYGGWGGGFGDWDAPWDVDPIGLASVDSGSATQAGTWQFCGSTVAGGVGVAAPITSPNTVWGDCDNANVAIDKAKGVVLVSKFDNTSVNLAPWQVCGSSTVDGVGAVAPIQSANTVIGDCNNANTVID